MELSIDTSTRYASVALSTDGAVVVEKAWRSEQNHSVEVAPSVRRLMDQAQTSMDQLDAVFVARGPGGFSALRVGISMAKAMAMAQGVPLIGVGTLEVEAYPYLGMGIPVCAVIEAGRKLVYAAKYGAGAASDGDERAEYTVETREDLLAGLPEGSLLCGEAAPTFAEEVRARQSSGLQLSETSPPTRKPGVLARLGYGRLQASDTDDISLLEPTYMRGSQFDVARRTHGVA